jgi:hypothetical protein
MAKRARSTSDKTQSERFIETAREIGCDEDASGADRLLGRLAKMPPQPHQQKVQRTGKGKTKPRSR